MSVKKLSQICCIIWGFMTFVMGMAVAANHTPHPKELWTTPEVILLTCGILLVINLVILGLVSLVDWLRKQGFAQFFPW